MSLLSVPSIHLFVHSHSLHLTSEHGTARCPLPHTKSSAFRGETKMHRHLKGASKIKAAEGSGPSQAAPVLGKAGSLLPPGGLEARAGP